jgi:hypothetical protein
VPSPLLYDGLLYFLKSNAAIRSVFDANTGWPHHQAQRLDGIAEVYSSPVAAQSRVYITGRDGTTVVLRHGPTLEVLARNTLDDGFDASAALVDGHIYLRGYRYLYDIAERRAASRGGARAGRAAHSFGRQADDEVPVKNFSDRQVTADAGASVILQLQRV